MPTLKVSCADDGPVKAKAAAEQAVSNPSVRVKRFILFLPNCPVVPVLCVRIRLPDVSGSMPA